MAEFHAAYQANPAATAQRQRQHALAQAQFRTLDPERQRQVTTAIAEIQAQAGDRAKRRAAERELGRYIAERVVPITRDPRILELPDKLHDCRSAGCYGVQPNGRGIIAFDSKCGELRLCPDEARADQQRLVERYLPPILDALGQGLRAHYVVLTRPNVAPGDLAAELAGSFKHLRALRRCGVRRCKVCATPYYSANAKLKARKRCTRSTGEDTTCGGKLGARRVAFPQIKGILAVLEAPLGAHADWHVHLNLVLLVDGWLDYTELRAAWGYNLEIRRLEGEGDQLRQALIEVIKYPVVLTAEKSDRVEAGGWRGDPSPQLELLASSSDRAEYFDAKGRVAAPPMTAWPPELWVEWYQAHQRFRRVRGYGLLHGVALDDAPTLDLDDVLWCGQLRLVGTGYVISIPLLGSIPGDNSPARRALTDRNAHRERAPPGDFAWTWAEVAYDQLLRDRKTA